VLWAIGLVCLLLALAIGALGSGPGGDDSSS
jgi:hypothetical protein